MRKLALSDEILLSVEKPARYIGNEINMVKKNPKDVDIRVAMCFPDVYEIGMSHLGIQILYELFNRREGFHIYCPYFSFMARDLQAMKKNMRCLAASERDFRYAGRR